MPHRPNDHPTPTEAGSTPVDANAYAPPAITLLGTLTELTLGGDDNGSPDGFGQAGFIGSV